MRSSFRWWQTSALLLLIITLVAACRPRQAPPPPQALLVLGGDPHREQFAAAFARIHPGLPIWVSSGSSPGYEDWVFAREDISMSRLHLDYRAVDTVTNFTTLVNTFHRLGITRVYLVTSSDHMPRAELVGDIVFGSHGISLEPIVVPCQRAPESVLKVWRDGARALLWVVTGHTGARFEPPHPP